MRFLLFFILLVSFQVSHADFWSGSSRNFLRTQLGNKVAISCHNCYAIDNKVLSLEETLSYIHSGQAAGADLIEIDMVAHNNSWVVRHDGIPKGSSETEDPEYLGPDFELVFQDSAFRNGSQVPFIELKSKLGPNVGDHYANLLIGTLNDLGYLESGKIVVIRSFHLDTLKEIKTALSGLTAQKQSRVKLSRAYRTNFEPDVELCENSEACGKLEAWQKDIARVKSNGYEMVELNFQTKNIASLIEYAKSLGLAVNLWTIRDYSEVFAAIFRESVDALTIDQNKGQWERSRETNIRIARSVISDPTNILHLNMAGQNYTNSNYLNYVDQTASRQIYRFSNGHPSWEWLGAIGEDRFGGSLIFDKNNAHFVRLHDGDNNSGEGFLVHAVVNFDSFSGSPTQAIVSKADTGGFALELSGGYLRFGVHVNGAYHYVKYPQQNFNGTDTYQIVGVYDGSGGVRMWVDGKEVGTPPVVDGEVTKNNSPIVIGADPQGWSNQRFFFSGKIQQVNVQRWGHH
ncbi:LamG-like jellyroll fold domain-containing protein [Microbulbifer sp. ALW1]|uniref:LamG-like jellyroll fold domain-containing protein n=1 Tax=Microbulbifer sp. (strain ALW1) TaxID=1516059 RepID=UPI00135B7E93|nr:LamG-like jellyroll fold domain-containing protein [Microbulbifer sp. ALW1]QRV71703.1 laminarinase [Microbulbifer sp. ALW1]